MNPILVWDDKKLHCVKKPWGYHGEWSPSEVSAALGLPRALHSPWYPIGFSTHCPILSTSQTSILGFKSTNVYTSCYKHWPWYSLGSPSAERNTSLLVWDAERMTLYLKASGVSWWMECLQRSRGKKTLSRFTFWSIKENPKKCWQYNQLNSS